MNIKDTPHEFGTKRYNVYYDKVAFPKILHTLFFTSRYFLSEMEDNKSFQNHIPFTMFVLLLLFAGFVTVNQHIELQNRTQQIK